jgi:hypothetical protein
MINLIRKLHVLHPDVIGMSQSIEDLHLDENMLGDGVDFVGLVTKNDHLAYFGNRDSLNLSKEQKEMFFMQCSLQQMMTQDYNDNFGHVKYSVIEREHNRIITVPQESDTLIFVMNSGDEFLSRVKRVLDAIRHARSLKQGQKGNDMT